MRAYGDSSFLAKLVSPEGGSEAARAEYRRLDLPPLFCLPLHALEVENAIQQRAFFQRRSVPAGQRAAIARERVAASARLRQMVNRGAFRETPAEWDEAVRRARALSARHTENNGARAYDLLHVAFALELEAEKFLTSDERQAAVAKAEGLRVIFVKED